MFILVPITLALLALVGHGLFWAGLINRVHGVSLARRTIKRINKLVVLAGAGLPLLLAWWAIDWLATGQTWQLFPPEGVASTAASGYLLLCWSTAMAGIVILAARKMRRLPSIVRSERSKRLTIDMPLAGRHFLNRLPGNETFQIERVDRELMLPGWPAALDGLTILHLSDLHFSGRVDISYFKSLVDLCQETPADLIAITGDVLDSAACIDWLPDTLGRLSAPGGVYFIRGNHEIKVDHQRVNRLLESLGLVSLSERWVEIEVRGARLVLAGNELPWFPPAADLTRAPDRQPNGPPRILLAHSPDQLTWARRHDVDLMLAGHIHGGQVRLPGIGALLSPSRHGLKYTAGVFYEAPTALFVTRGISGEWPVRYFCPPELARLTLRASR